MANEFIHVRVDPAKKREAERILNNLGLTLTTGVNLYLNSVIRAKGLPFDVKYSREELLGEYAFRMETRFQNSVAEAVGDARANGYPIALYDKERKCPYFEYPDGRRDYSV